MEELIEVFGALPSVLSNKGHLISNTKSTLEEEGAAKALELTLAHYADPVTQDIGFVHIMRS